MTLPAGIEVRWRGVDDDARRREVSRALLAEMLPGTSFHARCVRCGGEHGRLRVSGADATVSVSYVAGWAFAASGPAAIALGLDAAPDVEPSLERVLPGADARSWARVEAVLKADGRGLTVDPMRVVVEDAPPTGADWVARIDDDRPFTGWDVPGPAGVVLAVAARSRS